MGKEQAKIEVVKLTDMSGGLNSSWLSSDVEDNEAKECINTIWVDGALQVVPGYVTPLPQVGGSGSTTPLNAIHDYVQRNGTQYWVVVTDAGVYYLNTATNVWTSITGAVTITDNKYRLITFNNRVLGTNGIDVPWVWTGAGDIAALTVAPPATAKYIATFNGRVVLLNYTTGGNYYTTRAAYSGVDNQTTWDLTTNYWEVDQDDGDEITGATQLGDNFVIFCKNSISLVSGFGTPWTVTRGFIRGVGCASGDSIQHLWVTIGGGLREVVTFMSSEGPRAFDGTSVYPLPIPDEGKRYKCQEYFDGLDRAARNATISIYCPRRNWIYFFYSGDGAVTNTAGCIYAPQENALWPLEGESAKSACLRWNSSRNTWDVYVGTYDGQIAYTSESDKARENTTELTTDGNMEAVGTGSYTAIAGGVLTKNAVAFQNGLQSLQCVSTTLGDGFSQAIVTEANSYYQVRVWAISTAGAGLPAVTLKAFNGTDELSTATLGLSSTTWNQVDIAFFARSAITTIKVITSAEAAQTFLAEDLTARKCFQNILWESRYFDYGEEESVKYLREVVPFFTSIAGNVSIGIYYNKGTESAGSDIITMTAGTVDWALVDWTAVDWVSFEEVKDDLDGLTMDAFNTHNIKIQGSTQFIDMSLNKIFLSAKVLGKRWYHSA